MNTKLILTLAALLFNFSLYAQENDQIGIGKRFSIKSEVLNETRFYNVYLPASYSSKQKATYPVLYVIDGDYNFWYIAGLIEQMASIGNKIPEIIVVGIADKGHENYINNCTPNNKNKSPNGQSEKFLEFIIGELRHKIESSYRTADFNILVGHSLGGYFTVNALLSKPESFNAYIAISPSLWKNDYEAETQVDNFFKNNEHLNRYLFITLANEKGMGVLGFMNKFDINTFADEYYGNAPLGLVYKFQRYPNENHNSVGLISISEGLKYIFSGYDVGEDELEGMKSFAMYEERMKPYINKIGKGFRFPESQLTSLVRKFYNTPEMEVMQNEIQRKYVASLGDFYNALTKTQVRNKKPDEAVSTAEKNCSLNPKSPEYLATLAEALTANKQLDEAKEANRKALEIAREIKSRQWYINQLEADVSKTEKS